MTEADDQRDDAEPEPGDDRSAVDQPESDTTSRWSGAARWVFTRRLCFGGLVGALVFFCLSLTPSLLPRGWMFQGVVSGLAAALGYGVGSAGSAAVRRFVTREPERSTKRIAWRVLAGATIVLVPLFLWLGHGWQEEIRDTMGMDRVRAQHWGGTTAVAAVVGVILLAGARVIRGATRALIRLLARWVPRPVGRAGIAVVSVTLVILLITGALGDVVIDRVDDAFSITNDNTTSTISRPTSELKSGGPASIVEWDTLGTRGRDFTGRGFAPTVEEIEAHTGEPATEPIRVYVGLESAPSYEERAALALAELERTDAFDREVLLLISVTGTGWVNENVTSALEFMFGGDTAMVGMQYSYLPSTVTVFADDEAAARAGVALFDAVLGRIDELDPDDRPTVLVYGESLGSFGAESAFADGAELLARVDGALFVGPTFGNAIHREFTEGRAAGTPVWRPVLDAGRNVRFADQPSDLTEPELFGPDAAWESPRIVYLQNSNDPVVNFRASSAWKPPDWLDDRGPNVSDAMVWIPGVTFFQLVVDLANGSNVPEGYGHLYGSDVVDGWVGITAPDGWTASDTIELRGLIDARAAIRMESSDS